MELSVIQRSGKDRDHRGHADTKVMTWQEFLDRLQDPTILHDVTMKRYHALPKAEKDSLKNNGAFAGGVFAPVRKNRNRKSLLYRTMVTLDVDEATGDEWDDFTLMHDEWNAAMYTTCSSTPDAPRYRFILPLSRNVDPDEYEAVARMVATWFNIDGTDRHSFMVEHIMYWPTYCCDAPRVFDYQQGTDLDPDYVLSLYGDTDWHERINCPQTAWELEHGPRRKSRSEKMEDPRAKRGIIGDFCRCYSITDAIEKFLSDVYEPTDDPTRFTYRKGSSAKGLVVYDDTFAYSNHATDPCSERECNAFDLVRLHLFGGKDDGREAYGEDVDITKQPSYRAMLQLCEEDEDLKKYQAEERMQSIREEFGDLTDYSFSSAPSDTEASEESDDLSWMTELVYRPNTNELEPLIRNAVLILEHDPLLKGRLVYDEFQQRAVYTGAVPWRPNAQYGTPWEDDDDANLRGYIENFYNMKGRAAIDDALRIVLTRHRIHPVREYLKGLVWDGVPRVDDLLIRYCGAEDNKYTRAVTRKWMVGAVKRILQPGCKMDYMLMLIGEQGTGKSSIPRILAKEDWFLDSLQKLESSKDTIERMQGKWIIEVAEFAAVKRSDLDAVKAFVTAQNDTIRFSYGHRATTLNRQCIFFATSNDKTSLNDPTGNRRFWPIFCPDTDRFKVNRELPGEVDQLWAEAVVRWREGETLYLDDDTEAVAKEMQERAELDSGERGLLEAFLNMPVPEDYYELTLYQQRELYEQFISNEPTGDYLRNAICIIQIRNEMCGDSVDVIRTGNDSAARALSRRMDAIPGWHRAKRRHSLPGPIGRQRWFVRDGVEEDELFKLIPKELF